MQKLSERMVDPSGHSKEYKALCDCVKRAAGMNEKRKAELYRQANIDVMEAAIRYSKVKEKVRSTNEGKACFANTLDAVSVVTKHAPLSAHRARKWVNEINRIRNKSAADRQSAGEIRRRAGAAGGLPAPEAGGAAGPTGPGAVLSPTESSVRDLSSINKE